jgi:hypothetical protein
MIPFNVVIHKEWDALVKTADLALVVPTDTLVPNLVNSLGPYKQELLASELERERERMGSSSPSVL